MMVKTTLFLCGSTMLPDSILKLYLKLKQFENWLVQARKIIGKQHETLTPKSQNSSRYPPGHQPICIWVCGTILHPVLLAQNAVCLFLKKWSDMWILWFTREVAQTALYKSVWIHSQFSYTCLIAEKKVGRERGGKLSHVDKALVQAKCNISGNENLFCLLKAYSGFLMHQSVSTAAGIQVMPSWKELLIKTMQRQRASFSMVFKHLKMQIGT